MPTVNMEGEIIPDLSLNYREQQRIRRLSLLKYPQDEQKIFHLTPADFRIWLYVQNPREALLLCSTSVISNRVRHQIKKWRWSLISDFFWRMCH